MVVIYILKGSGLSKALQQVKEMADVICIQIGMLLRGVLGVDAYPSGRGLLGGAIEPGPLGRMLSILRSRTSSRLYSMSHSQCPPLGASKVSLVSFTVKGISIPACSRIHASSFS